jgi:hypothetical protein
LNSRKLIVLFMITLLTFGAYDALAGCASSCGGCDGCEGTDTEFKVFGSSRYRMNTMGFDFNSDTPLSWGTEIRNRVGIKAKANDKAGAFFQLQDCRMLGDVQGWNFGTDDVQMHQGYFWYKPCEKGWLKGGRMEVTLHNGRLISSVPWDQTGRTFDGLMFGRKVNDNVSLTGFSFQLDENRDNAPGIDNDPNKPIADPMVYGLNVNLAEQDLDFFVYYFKMPFAGGGVATDDLTLMTFGVYTQRDITEGLWFDGMFAMQSGTHDDGVDLSGMMFNGTLGKCLDNGLSLAAGVDYTTGDDPGTADKYESFNNLFMDYHRYWGAMDMGMDPMGNEPGLMDLFFKAKYAINGFWTAGGVYHMFSGVEDVNVAAGEKTIGTEIDLFVKYNAEDFSWRTGYGMFSRNEDTFGPNQDTQGWWYSSATVDW